LVAIHLPGDFAELLAATKLMHCEIEAIAAIADVVAMVARWMNVDDCLWAGQQGADARTRLQDCRLLSARARRGCSRGERRPSFSRKLVLT